MGVLACEGLELCEEVGASALGGDPFVAVLKNELADLGNEGRMAICWTRTQLGPKDAQTGHF